MNLRVRATNNQALIGAGLLLFALLAGWQIAGIIAANDMRKLFFVAIAIAGCAAAIAILNNWRRGFYLFFVWMIFEDLVRKYTGNNLFLFFGKDILLALIYVSFFAAVRRKREKVFRPPFVLFLSMFFWLGVIQIFNQNSPSILYGLLGIKMYFYYAPLMFIGYSLVRNDEQLKKFLVLNAVLAIVVSSIGIIQSVVGNSFLNPTNLAPDLQELGNLQKVTASGQAFNLPDSVFVSTGRYAAYLAVAFSVTMGAAGFLLLYRKKNRKLMFIALGLIGVAALMSGSRGTFVTILMTAGLLSVGFIWGAPWRSRRANQMLKAIRRTVFAVAAALVLMIFLFPKQAGARLEFYTDTLSPNSSDYQLGFRSWDYPLQNLLKAFDDPNWIWGNGIGTAALGTQYVQKIVGKAGLPAWVEEGFGTMIVEMGILAPFLWIFWSASLLYFAWKVARELRQTRFFPIALSITWYCFVLLFLWTWGGLDSYENYTCNIFLWLLVGVLFALPDIARKSEPAIDINETPRRDQLVYQQR
ncbi:MAG: hypothetical protein ACRD40_13990 [Candidatus Acidiferrales bacterium]